MEGSQDSSLGVERAGEEVLAGWRHSEKIKMMMMMMMMMTMQRRSRENDENDDRNNSGMAHARYKDSCNDFDKLLS